VSVAWCCPVAQGAIDYETSDLTALAGQDYQRTSGTLTFTGHAGNVIRVPIIDDDSTEGEERFEVRLTDFKGSFVKRGRETAIVRLLEEDPKQPSITYTSPRGSSQQATGSRTSSSSTSTRPTVTTIVPVSSEPSSPVGGSGDATRSDQTLEGQSIADGESMSVVDKPLDANTPLSLLLYGGLAILLVVSIAVRIGLERNLADNNGRGGR
jgi:hypothetical protein